MRLVIPLAIRELKADGIIKLMERTASERGVNEISGWAKAMATDIERWATASLEDYYAARDLESSS